MLDVLCYCVLPPKGSPLLAILLIFLFFSCQSEQDVSLDSQSLALTLLFVQQILVLGYLLSVATYILFPLLVVTLPTCLGKILTY